MRLAILVDVSTNRRSGFALDIQIASKSDKVARTNAFGGFEWPQMFSNVRQQYFGGFKLPWKMQRLLQGCLKGG